MLIRTLSFLVRLLSIAMAMSFASPALAETKVNAGLKTFDQILYSYIVATGVSIDTPIREYFANIKSRLPRTGDIEEMNSAMLAAATGLAGMICEKMIAQDSNLAPASRRAHKDIDFSLAPSALPEAARLSTFRAYTQLFWLRLPSHAEENILLKTFSDAIGAEDTTAEATKKMLKLECSTVAVSIAALVN